MVKKEWYKSKTLWASFAAFAITLLSSLFGETNALVTFAVACASALGIYGRSTASGGLK